MVIELCVKTVAGRVPVIAGAGSNSTAEAVRLSKNAEAVGADGILIVSPYYNKPTQAGLTAHLKLQRLFQSLLLSMIFRGVPSYR